MSNNKKYQKKGKAVDSFAVRLARQNTKFLARIKTRSFMSFPPRLKGKAAKGQFKPVRKKSKKK